jgi:glycosyltransferase involved in cell wall biosynthesis
MIVLQLGPYPPPHGGVQTNLVAIRRYLMSRGTPCYVINLTRHRRPDGGGVHYPRGAAAVLRLLLRLPFTVAHLHIGGDLAPRLLLLGLICCLLPRVKTVLTFHSGGYPTSPEGRTARPWSWRGFVLRRFDRLIAVNRQLHGLFVDKFGVPAERVRFILPYAPPGDVSGVCLPPHLEEFFGSHQPVLLSMGWLEPEYDFPLQIEALGTVRESFPQAGLVILGEGRLEGPLRRLIQATPYPEAVLLGGDISHDTALAAIARSDIFLRTTLYDGDSISVREALHLGTPVIATDNGMRPPGVTLVPFSDVSSLAGAICRQLAQGRPPSLAAPTDDHIAAVYDLYREIAG